MMIRRIILVLFQIFSAILVVECFFWLNDRLHFVEPAKLTYPPPPERLSKEETRKKFQVDLDHVADPTRNPIDAAVAKLINPKIDPSYEKRFYELLTGQVPAQAVIVKSFLPPNENFFLYSAEYRINSQRRRLVERPKGSVEATRYYLAFGDSFTFGEGVTNGLDYPSQLQKLIAPDWTVYNFGKPGYAPNDLLHAMQNDENILDEVKEDNGVAVWYFIGAQFERFFCTIECYQNGYNEYIQFKPEYVLENGRLKELGAFSKNNSLQRKLLKIAAASPTLRFFGIGATAAYSNEQLTAFALTFGEIFKILKIKKNTKKMFILFTDEFPQRAKVTELLNEQGIEALSLATIPFHLIPNFQIPMDSHPTGNFYWALSQFVGTTLSKTTGL